jgi:hypothetical protein
MNDSASALFVAAESDSAISIYYRNDDAAAIATANGI